MSNILGGNRLVDYRGEHRVDWQSMKKQSNRLAVIYRYLSAQLFNEKKTALSQLYRRKSENVAECNNVLLFGVPDGADEVDKRLIYAHNCRDRNCVLCQHKKSNVYAYRLNSIVSTALTRFTGLEFIFVTFTVKNVPNSPVALKKSQRELSAAFSRLMRRSRITGGRFDGKVRPYDERIIKGAVRKFEVTYKERTDEFNTHLHVLFAVDSKYFDKNEAYFINHDEWVRLWRESLRVDYDPSVRVQAIRGNVKGDSAIRSSIKELVKYETKPLSVLRNLETKPDSSLMDHAAKVIFALTEGLRGARSFGLLGIFREISDELFKRDFSDVSDDEMINADDTKEIDLDKCTLIQYKWDSCLKDFVECPVAKDLVVWLKSRKE